MKSFITIFLAFFICNQIAVGQTDPNYYIDIPAANQEQVFEKTLQLLLGSEYFIQSVDKDAGLIQCKAVMDDKRLFSSKDGSIIEYNLLIRLMDDDSVRIAVQANLTEKRIIGTVGNGSYHNNDLGVTQKSEHFDKLLGFLQQYYSK